jgi:hypothetical protein
VLCIEAQLEELVAEPGDVFRATQLELSDVLYDRTQRIPSCSIRPEAEPVTVPLMMSDQVELLPSFQRTTF